MKLAKGFTILEVIVAIFVFSSGMLAFMGFHARAQTMIFESETSQTANALAVNLVEEINSMTPERFFLMCDTGVNQGGYMLDSLLTSYIDSLRNEGGTVVNVSPFNSLGKPIGGMSSESYMFYRLVRISTFDEESDSFHPDPSLYGKLRHIDVTVAWPKRGHGTEKCTGLGRVNCNYITIPVVKFIEST